MTTPNTQTVFPSDALDVLNTLYAAYLAHPAFDATNTATGATSVTVNGMSGIAVFTQDIATETQQVFTINNSSITTSSVVRLSMKYEQADSENPIICNYSTLNAGELTVVVYNQSPDFAVEGSMSISFEIIN